jgi:phage-related protein
MDKEDYYYDRTRNLKDIDYVDLTGFCPSYGLQAEFSSNNELLQFDDNYFSLKSKGANALKLTFSASYEVDQGGAQKIANRLESLSGDNAILFSTNNFIYKDLSGYCDGYSINHVSDTSYKVNTTISVDEAPNLFNWKNTNFTQYEFKEWSTGLNYEVDDIAYFDNSKQKLDNFYYCTGKNLSTSSNSPTGLNSAWTQSFYWEPDIGLSNEVKFSVTRFDGSWQQRSKTQKNISLVPLNYNFNSISKKQLMSMLHFLEMKGGYKRFRHEIPTVYNKPKIYICTDWVHNWNNPESHNLSVSFKEDPLGVIAKNVGVGGFIPSRLGIYDESTFSEYDPGYTTDQTGSGPTGFQ